MNTLLFSRFQSGRAGKNRRSMNLPLRCSSGSFLKRGRRFTAMLTGAILFANLFLLTACGGASAASIYLKQTEGSVHVADGEGKSLEPENDLALYSGYRVGTGAKSYAWVDLDKAKLTKLDESSEIEIQKENKALTINVLSGSLFFNVSEPLAEDETMEICTSSMLVGIRGTCGWVNVPDAQHMELYLLEGSVACTAGENTVSVRAGEKAAMSTDGGIDVSPFTVGEIPGFVIHELKDDSKLLEEISNDSGLDIAAHPTVKYGDTYEDVMADIDGTILQIDEVDFDLDGSPELTVLSMQEDAGFMYVTCNIYRTGPDGLVYAGGYGDIFFSDNGQFRDGSFSLVESDGRIYQKWHNVYEIKGENSDTNIQEMDAYYGLVPAKTGDGTEMFLEKLLYGESHYGTNIQKSYSIRYADGGGVRISAEEYEAYAANFREIRLIAYTQDNTSVVVAAGPANN